MSEVDAESTDLATNVDELNITATESTKMEPEPASTEKNLKILPCGNCGKECTLVCGNCGKEGYCSVLCQKARRSKHKDDCFPAKEEIGDGFRSRGTGPRPYWIATRDIKEGEKIFTDYPLMVGPGEEHDGPGAHVCIGCHEILMNFSVESDARKCSQCRWPICGPTCSGTQRHLKECGTLCLMRQGMAFEFAASCPEVEVAVLYKTIRHLRLLALIKSSPRNWERFLNLHVPALALNNVFGLYSANVDVFDGCTEFWKNACGVDELTNETMCRLTAAEQLHHKPSYNGRANKAELVIYDKETRIDISCSENCYIWPIRPSENKKKNPHGIVVIAAKPIQKGQRLTMSFGVNHEWDGTKRRRQIQMKNPLNVGDPNLGFICKCPRCVEPTELGTYVSAVKCKKCPMGYLLPLNPLDDDSNWKCDSQACSRVIPGSVVDKIVDKIQKAAYVLETFRPKLIGWKNDSSKDPLAMSLALIDKVEDFMKKYGKELHPHHYILLQAQDISISDNTIMLLNIIPKDKEPRALEGQRHHINRLRTIAGIFLDIATKLFPPFSNRRLEGHFFVSMCEFFSAQQAVIDGREFDTVLNFLKDGISHKHSMEEFKRNKNCPLIPNLNDYEDGDQDWSTLLDAAYKNAIESCSSNPSYRRIPDQISEFVQNLCGAEETPSVEVEAPGKN